MRRSARLVTAMIAATLVAACGDDGPSGPGTLRVTVSGTTELGAAVIDFAGEGLGIPSTGQTDWVEGVATEAGLRVLVVSDAGGVLTFEVPVSDLSLPLPTATVVQASRADDRRMFSVNGITVSIAH